ncbi:hypothetical protein AB0B30_27210 [Streptomyces narbonensis]|uniref:UDP-N-acetylmuramyl pentapeptide phosphotransferase/UDP-N-acetylglucosamine-1-phosphate transferase n=1 Tax=Streptomyces narbonensis TaxID=67333 RepID=A0ABV3CLV4_9ACTN
MRRLAAFGVAAGVTRAVYEGLRRSVGGSSRAVGDAARLSGALLSVGGPSSAGDPLSVGGPSAAGDPLWMRTNHAGRAVDLYSGPATALGAAAGSGSGPVALAVLAAAACGAYDDVKGDHRRGFRAHLAALRHGEVTSGAVKLLGIGAASLAAGAMLKERPVDKVLAGVVIAGSAHLVNLVDVRPGRACLAVLALGAPGLVRGSLAAAPMGAASAVLGEDLGERTMLGDTGAHALGAAVGGAIAAGNGRFGLLAHAAGLVAAAAWGEWDATSRAHPSG